MRRPPLPPLAALAAALALLAPARAAAEEPGPAAARVAASLAAQVAKKGPARLRLAVAPAREPAAPAAAAAVRAFAERLGPELARAGAFEPRDWAAVDATTREKTLQAVTGGALALPPVPDVQAILVAEATDARDGQVRLQLRLVAVPAGNVLATEAARLEAGPPPARVESASVEVAIRRLSDALAGGFARLPGSSRYRRLAVLPFAETGPEAKRRELGTVVGAQLSSDLRRDHGLLLVERARLGAVLAEVKLSEMGVVDPKDAPRIGKVADAQALVLGEVAEAGDRFLVTARIVSAETAETLATGAEAIAAAGLVALSSEAAVLRSRGDAALRSLLLPGWGQAYNRQRLKGAVFAGLAAATVGGAVAFQVIGAGKEKDYESLASGGLLGPDPAAKAAALRADAERAYRLRNGFVAGAAAVWAAAVLDAYLFGVDGERVADGLAVVAAPGGAGLGLAVRF